MTYPLCRYIRTTGQQCQSPALNDQRFCYFHTNSSKRHRNFRPNHVFDHLFEPGQHLRLAALEDRESIQMAISQVVNALATNQIDIKRGRVLLYGLQLAGAHVTALETRPAPTAESIVQSTTSSVDHLDLAPSASSTSEQTARADEATPTPNPPAFEEAG